MKTFGIAARERAGLIEHFREHGWVAVEALNPSEAAAPPGSL
jgi:hypothetical protein